MSFMYVDPLALNEAAVSLMKIATDMKSFSDAAAPVTNDVAPPGKDQVSHSAATHLAKHAVVGHEKIARAAKTLEQYALNMELSAAAYSSTEDDNAKTVQPT